MPSFPGLDIPCCFGPKELPSFGWNLPHSHPHRGELVLSSHLLVSDDSSPDVQLKSSFPCPRLMVNESDRGRVEVRVAVVSTSLAALLSALQGGQSMESLTLFPRTVAVLSLSLFLLLPLFLHRVCLFRFRGWRERGRVRRPILTLNLSCVCQPTFIRASYSADLQLLMA